MNLENVIYEVKESIARITMNRPHPQTPNMLDIPMWNDLQAALDEAELDPEVRVVILTGAGGDFSRGWNMESPYMRTPEGYDQWGTASAVRQMTLIKQQYEKLLYFPKPTIAKVEGRATTAGCNLQLFCDVAIAAEDAKLGHEAMGGGGVDIAPWIFYLGPRKAKELWLTGRIIDGKEAERIGLVNRAVPADKLEEEVWNEAKLMARVPTDEGEGHGMRLTKAYFNGAMKLMGFENLFTYHLAFNAWGHSFLGKIPREPQQ